MVNIKSYLNTAIFTARLSAASAAVFILSSCGGKYGNPSLELQDNPAGIYREYLSGIRMQDGLSTDSLTVLLRQWLTVRDSVFAHVRRDTTQQVHSGAREECLTLHDSIRAEFFRLAISRSRTYKEVLTLKERLSPYAGDKELHRSAEEVRPFFASLDKRPAYRGDKEKILPSYRALLSGTLKDDIHGHDDLKRFIEKEDAVFRTFMAHLHSFGKVNMSDITRDTEKCCARIFLAAGRQEITYKEAMIYMAMRTNRRLILNVETCLDDIHRGKVTTPEQAHAYIWMILQPYASLDGFCIALLSDREKETLYKLAGRTPEAFRALKEMMHAGNDRLEELPGMLMEIFIATL